MAIDVPIPHSQIRIVNKIDGNCKNCKATGRITWDLSRQLAVFMHQYQVLEVVHILALFPAKNLKRKLCRLRHCRRRRRHLFTTIFTLCLRIKICKCLQAERSVTSLTYECSFPSKHWLTVKWSQWLGCFTHTRVTRVWILFVLLLRAKINNILKRPFVIKIVK